MLDKVKAFFVIMWNCLAVAGLVAALVFVIVFVGGRTKNEKTGNDAVDAVPSAADAISKRLDDCKARVAAGIAGYLQSRRGGGDPQGGG